jgi:hypothetical protein
MMTIRPIPLLAAFLLPLAACELPPSDEAADTLGNEQSALDGVPVTWRTDGPGSIIQGSGCNGTAGPNQDAWAIAAGQDVAIVLTRMTIELPGNGPDAVLAQRRQCSVRLPVTIAAGYYLSSLAQTMIVGATKSDNVDIDGAARSTFFNLPLSSPRIHAPAGPGTAINSSQLSASVEDLFPASSFFCRPGSDAEDVSGFFSSNIAVSGTRATSADDLLVSTDALDVRWDVATTVSACP